jgi:hypothetical protein
MATSGTVNRSKSSGVLVARSAESVSLMWGGYRSAFGTGVVLSCPRAKWPSTDLVTPFFFIAKIAETVRAMYAPWLFATHTWASQNRTLWPMSMFLSIGTLPALRAIPLSCMRVLVCSAFPTIVAFSGPSCERWAHIVMDFGMSTAAHFAQITQMIIGAIPVLVMNQLDFKRFRNETMFRLPARFGGLHIGVAVAPNAACSNWHRRWHWEIS